MDCTRVRGCYRSVALKIRTLGRVERKQMGLVDVKGALGISLPVIKLPCPYFRGCVYYYLLMDIPGIDSCS